MALYGPPGLILERLDAAPDTVGDLGLVVGFRDPTGKNVDACMGPKMGSSFCGYGAEFSCAVMGALLQGDAAGHASTSTPNATAAAPRAAPWVPMRARGGSSRCHRVRRWTESSTMQLRAPSKWRGATAPRACLTGSKCAYGLAICPS